MSCKGEIGPEAFPEITIIIINVSPSTGYTHEHFEKLGLLFTRWPNIMSFLPRDNNVANT
jgi:hypothetical protein